MSNLQSPQGQDELQRSLVFQQAFNAVVDRIHEAESFTAVMPEVIDELRSLLAVDRFTVYQRGRLNNELVSAFKVGDSLKEIRVPLSNTSISGHVGLNPHTIRIDDVYDAGELQRIHPDLRFDSSFDQRSGFRTRSMVVTPIKYQQVLLGVLQVLNKNGGEPFSDEDVANVERIARVIGQKLRYDMETTRGPYDYLVSRGQVSRNQLEEFQKRAPAEGVTVAYLLASEARITPSEVGASLEYYYQVPYQAFDPEMKVPAELIKGLKESYLRNQLWVPIAGDRKSVTVLIDDPTDTDRVLEIQRLLRAEHYIFKVGLPDDILRFLGQDAGGTVGSVDLTELVGRMEEEKAVTAPQASLAEADGPVDENEATVIKLVNRLILNAYQARASDIHVEPGKGEETAVVRFRVDGVCRPALRIPASHVRAVVSRIKIMARLDISERRKPQDGKLTVSFRGRPLELRVATVPTVNGESVVMRILAASEPLPLDKLNLTPRNVAALEEAVAHPHGIFLVVGPTGSGKTTTLHAVLGHINTPERKIWTAEDPVEITQSGLQQVQVQPKIGLTFAAALRSFLRADPDVIMIGEMRDQETAEAGVEASLTGHLVFSTLHTNSAPETVVRLLELGIDPLNFADAFLGVLAQRLVRTLCPRCREAYYPEPRELEKLRHFYGEAHFDELAVDPATLELYRAKGCEACDNTGYRGRTGIHELMLASPALADLIHKRSGAGALRETAVSEGMRTLMQDGIAKLVAGQIDFEQLHRVVAE